MRSGAVEAVEGTQEGLVIIQAVSLHQLRDAQIGGLQLLVKVGGAGHAQIVQEGLAGVFFEDPTKITMNFIGMLMLLYVYYLHS